MIPLAVLGTMRVDSSVSEQILFRFLMVTSLRDVFAVIVA